MRLRENRAIYSYNQTDLKVTHTHTRARTNKMEMGNIEGEENENDFRRRCFKVYKTKYRVTIYYRCV